MSTKLFVFTTAPEGRQNSHLKKRQNPTVRFFGPSRKALSVPSRGTPRPRFVHSPAQVQNPNLCPIPGITTTNDYHLHKIGSGRQTGARPAPRVFVFIRVHSWPNVFPRSVHSPAQVQNPNLCPTAGITTTNDHHLHNWVRSANRRAPRSPRIRVHSWPNVFLGSACTQPQQMIALIRRTYACKKSPALPLECDVIYFTSHRG